MSIVRGQVIWENIQVKLVANEKHGHRSMRPEGVRRGNGMEIAVEMKIDFLAGLNLRFPSACGAPFHTKDRPEEGSRE